MVVTVVALGAVALGPTAHAQSSGVLVLTPAAGEPDTRFTATVNGFPSCPGGFSVSWDSPAITRRGESALPTATHFVPSASGAGVHTVTATCVTGGAPPQVLTASSLFQVTLPPPAPAPQVLAAEPVPAPVSRVPTEALAEIPATSPPVVSPAPAPVPAPAPQPLAGNPATAATVAPAPARAPDRARPTRSDSGNGLPAGLVLAGLAALVLAAGAFVFALLRKNRLRGTPALPVGPAPATLKPARNLSQLADDLLGDEKLPALAHAGSASGRITEACGGDEAVATPLIATLLWESVVTDERFATVLADAGASERALGEGRFVVVRHAGETRHDLLVLDPGFVGSAPTATPVEVWPSVADTRVRPAGLSWTALLSPDETAPWSSLDEATIESALEEAAATERWGVIVARPPELLLTQCPSPAWPVGVQGTRAPVATAGAVVRAPDGSVAVTTALHGITGKHPVSVARRPGHVTSRDEATDSCLIAVPGLPAEDKGRGRAGPMHGMAPRQFQRATFDGLASGQASTTVTGWDVDILAPRAAGSRVYTTADTVPGDSGSALIDVGDLIIAFATHRSAFGEPIEYSAWVWADHVFHVHGAQLWHTSQQLEQLVP